MNGSTLHERLHGGRRFEPGGPALFDPAVPDRENFPHATWRAIEEELDGAPATFRHPDPAGEPELRRAIATYVAGTRGGRVHADQVRLTTDTRQALRLVADLLLEEDDVVLFEDPGHPAARAAFGGTARIRPVAVDEEGMTVPGPSRAGDRVRLAYVTPSHQFPLGHTMSMGRRRDLVAWAATTGTWLVEDERHGWYRFAGRPLPSLFGLDESGSVIQVGDFQTLLSPRCLLGFAILAPSLAGAARARPELGTQPPDVRSQLVLARFIETGGLARHVRTMRAVYERRRNRLLEGVGRVMGNRIRFGAADAGTHLLLREPPWISAERIVERLAAAGVEAFTVDDFATTPCPWRGVVLGYGGVGVHRIDDGVAALLDALH